jgi:hypothetical protein
MDNQVWSWKVSGIDDPEERAAKQAELDAWRLAHPELRYAYSSYPCWLEDQAFHAKFTPEHLADLCAMVRRQWGPWPNSGATHSEDGERLPYKRYNETIGYRIVQVRPALHDANTAIVHSELTYHGPLLIYYPSRRRTKRE